MSSDEQHRLAGGDSLVSVIVPTRNSSPTLEACLMSIREQTYRKVEVIVVDGSSTDDTVRIAELYGSRVIQTRHERSASRNLGVAMSQGATVLFVDSDMRLSRTLIEECVQLIQMGFDALVIPEASIGEGFWAKCRALEKECYVGDVSIEAPRAFDKQTFIELGGYDNQLVGGEDWDLSERCKQARLSIGRANAKLYHKGHEPISRAVAKKFYYGKTILSYITKHPQLALRQILPVRLAFVRNLSKLRKDPVHAAGLIFLKLMEFFAMSLGIAASLCK